MKQIKGIYNRWSTVHGRQWQTPMRIERSVSSLKPAAERTAPNINYSRKQRMSESENDSSEAMNNKRIGQKASLSVPVRPLERSRGFRQTIGMTDEEVYKMKARKMTDMRS
uniref:Uncharacterized protein n=1 Tax=Parascaris univalens TaxID=6257 RepID=A0A915A7F4_PARUN